MALKPRDRSNDILVWEDKHDTTYWAASSTGELYASAVEIVKIMNNARYYIHPGELYREPELKLYTEEEIEALPEEFRKEALRRDAVRKRNVIEHARALENWKLLEAALEGDGAAAWEWLQLRSDYQYEEVRLRQLTNPLKNG